MLAAFPARRQTGRVQYRARDTFCSHCGDTVVIAEPPPLRGFGWKFRKPKVEATRLEHADPSPDGEVFDGVDSACRRDPVRPGYPR